MHQRSTDPPPPPTTSAAPPTSPPPTTTAGRAMKHNAPSSRQWNSTIPTPPLAVGVPLLLLLSSSIPRGVGGTCRFPDFLQREAPWAASYGQDARLVMYVKGTYMTVSEQGDHGDTKYTRRCERRAPDNKFLITQQENRDDPLYLCIQFLQRSENIVQMKVSSHSHRQSLELCDERVMAIDRWPIVQISQTPEQKIPCPFVGGYNVHMYYPNDTSLCQGGNTLLMRVESECEQGEGIEFDFREPDCVPAGLPRETKQQAYCIAHWTQVGQTFIILQHAQVHEHIWCLRISDPLSEIQGAHLMLDLVCDTGHAIRDTRNYFRMTMSRRVYASTCEDEIETDVCKDMKHLCKSWLKRHCARTCGTCSGGKNQRRDCAFEETYRGLWVESGQTEDRQLYVDPYSLTMDNLGRYECLRLEGTDEHKDRTVLARIEDNGCYPRYACVEMEKVSSSVMRFRLGNRHQWPLPQANDLKDHVCSADNFLAKDGEESRFHSQRPARLLVKDSYHSVPCGLPRRLHNGVAFREEGQSCSGCLMFQPSVSRDRFVVRPHNCSSARHPHSHQGRRQHHVTTIEYSCLAAFKFTNNTFAVVTKTNADNLFGQYLCWVFTPDDYIKVLKAAETFLLEDEMDLNNPELPIEAQFTIVPSDSRDRCHNVIAPPSPSRGGNGRTTTPRWLVDHKPPVTPAVFTARPTNGATVTYRVPDPSGTVSPYPPLPEPEGSLSQNGTGMSAAGCVGAWRTHSVCTLCLVLLIVHAALGMVLKGGSPAASVER